MMKQFSCSKLFTVVFFLLLLPGFLFASGKLKGTVVDSLTHETLIGANVILDGTSLGSATDIEGEFLISTIPAGTYTVRCSYIGYKQKEVTVTIPDGKTVELGFSLSLDVIEGKEIQVTAQALGQAAAINQQISSNRIANVISEQKIQELPDANAAESLGRLPGVSLIRSGGEAYKVMLRGLSENLTTITVDGVKLAASDADGRGVDLSTISQGTLAGIVLTKAITSDMDGEAIAGNINFVTKRIPEERKIQVDAFNSYSGLDNTFAQYKFIGRVSDRYFSDKLGVEVSGIYEKRNRSSEEYSTSIDQTLKSGQDYEIDDLNLIYVDQDKWRKGAKLHLDFDTPDDGLIKFNAEYNRSTTKYAKSQRDYPLSGAIGGYYYRAADTDVDIVNTSLTGDNHVYSWDVDWGLSFTQSKSDTPFDYDMSFTEPSTTDEDGNIISGMLNITDTEIRRGNPLEARIPYACNNFAMAYVNRAKSRPANNLDFERTAFADLKKSYNLTKQINGEFKFGGKYRSKYHRRVSNFSVAHYYSGNELYDYVKLADGSVVEKDWDKYGFGDLVFNSSKIAMSNFVSGDTRDLFGKFNMDPIYDKDVFRNWYDLNINGYNPTTKIDEYDVDRSENAEQYNLKENVAAGYLMNTLNVGTLLTVITGVRVESDDNTYHGLYYPGEIDEYTTFRDTTSKFSETIVLPNFHLIVKPTDYLNLRFAAYKGINRPNFNYRLPTYLITNSAEDNEGTKLLKMGNTNLKNATAWNYEINIQVFGNKIGLLSFSAYYKEIKNGLAYIDGLSILDEDELDGYGVTFLNGNPPYSAQYALSYPYNSQHKQKIWGFELEHQANLRFLPGLLSNIVLGYNVSLVKSEAYSAVNTTSYDTVTIAGREVVTTVVGIGEVKGRLADSPELFGNLTAGYDIKGFSARVSYFYQDEYYSYYSTLRNADKIKKSYGRLDLSLKQQINEKLSIGLNVNNINNVEEGEWLKNNRPGFPNVKLDSGSLRYGTTGDLWVRVSI